MSLSDPGNVSSALNFATLANPSRSFYGGSGSGPNPPTPGGGVTQIVAGNGISVSPAGGTGVVTVSAASGGLGMASNARAPYTQLVDAIPGPASSGVNGVVGVTCPVGTGPVSGVATFSFCLNNQSSTTPMSVRFGLFKGPSSPPLTIIDEYQFTNIAPGAFLVVSRTFPILNMTGNQVVQGYVVQQGTQTISGQIVEDPTLSVVWGGTANVGPSP
jgi:hypothetical protein